LSPIVRPKNSKTIAKNTKTMYSRQSIPLREPGDDIAALPATLTLDYMVQNLLRSDFLAAHFFDELSVMDDE
jgi:hypothetical protein